MIFWFLFLAIAINLSAQENKEANDQLEFMSLEDLMNVEVTIISITLNKQKITNVPGVVTVITQEQLKSLGIQTLQEALTLVPGCFPLQNDDENLVSVRGIFGTTNQKILFMRDGHSLNEPNLDNFEPDYALALDNVKKIEVIRGPGASIYGNSAYSGVVSVITNDTEGSRVKLGIGNYGQINLEGFTGHKTPKGGYFQAFGRFSNTEGQSFDVTIENSKSETLPGTYKKSSFKNNYDFGFKFNNELINMAFSTRHHRRNFYNTISGEYTNVDSLPVQPNLINDKIHFDFTLTPKVNDKMGFHLQNYADYGMSKDTRRSGFIDNGTSSIFEWKQFKMGANYYGYCNYSDKGQLLFGASIEQR